MHRSDDRRRQVKSANRRAILDAAASLAEERGLGHFTVTDLAERAGVSRRTIFNHFASVDDAVYARFSELLGVIVDDFVELADATPPPASPSTAAVFEQLADVIERTELLAAHATAVRRHVDHPDPAAREPGVDPEHPDGHRGEAGTDVTPRRARR